MLWSAEQKSSPDDRVKSFNKTLIVFNTFLTFINRYLYCYLIIHKSNQFFMTIQEIKTTYTKEFIQDKLSTDLRWIERSLIKLYERQTRDEQRSKETTTLNGVGFNSSDSRYLTYCSEWVLKGNHLSRQHVEKCGTKLKKYWKQIQDEIIRTQV